MTKEQMLAVIEARFGLITGYEFGRYENQFDNCVMGYGYTVEGYRVRVVRDYKQGESPWNVLVAGPTIERVGEGPTLNDALAEVREYQHKLLVELTKMPIPIQKPHEYEAL